MSPTNLRTILLELPFVSILDHPQANGMHMDLWSVTPVGDWAANNALGRIYARETLAVIKATGAANLLSEVAKAQMAGHTGSGLETGFAQFFGELALKS